MKRNIPTIDMVATGKNIVRLRKSAGLTVKDLQDVFGFGTPQVRVLPHPLCLRVREANGDNEKSDITVGQENILPFAINNASDSKPDLIYEMNKHFEIVFEKQKSSSTYTAKQNFISCQRSKGSRKRQ